MFKVKTSFWPAFIVVWTAYACTYLLRKPIGVIKAPYSRDLNINNTQLGLLDMAMLSSYATFQMLFGKYADRIGPRRTLAIGLLGGGIAMLPFVYIYQYKPFIVMLFVSGAFQSFCWAACTTGLTRWLPEKRRRQTMLGYFGTSPFIGGILGTLIAFHMMKRFGWIGIFVLPALANIVASVAVYVIFRYPAKTDPPNTSGSSNKYGFLYVAKYPGMIACALAVTCLKIVRYGMYFWLPLYFEEALQYMPSHSSYLSTLFDLGAAAGSLTAGISLRLFFKQNSLAGSAIYSFLSAISLSLFVLGTKYTSGSLQTVVSIVLIALTGALNGAPDVLLCGAIPLEFAPPQAANAFVGFVNGLGSIGGAIEGPLLGYVVDRWNWQGALVTMIAFSFMAALCCVRMAWAIKSAGNKVIEAEETP